MLSDPYLIILGLIFLVMLVQVWSVQRVEKRQKHTDTHIITRDKVIDDNTAYNMRSEDIHRTIAVSLNRLDSLLVEKGVSETLILADLIVRGTPETKPTTDALPSVE